MGWTPAQVGACGVWEFLAAVDGYVRSQGGDESGRIDPLSVTDEQWAALGVEFD